MVSRFGIGLGPRALSGMAAAAGAGFAVLAWLVGRAGWTPYDQAVIDAMVAAQEAVADRRWVAVFARDLSSLGSMTVMITAALVIAGGLTVARRWRVLAALTAVLVGGWAVNTVLKLWVARPRPGEQGRALEVLTHSFPSAHAMLSLVFYVALVAAVLAAGRWGRAVAVYLYAAAVVVAVSVGLSRVYLAVHFPTDVLAGWLGGVAWLCVCGLVIRAAGGRAGR